MADARIIQYMRDHADYPEEAVARALLDQGYSVEEIAKAEDALHGHHGQTQQPTPEVAQKTKRKNFIGDLVNRFRHIPPAVPIGIVLVLVVSGVAAAGYWLGAVRSSTESTPPLPELVEKPTEEKGLDGDVVAFQGELPVYESCGAVQNAFASFTEEQAAGRDIPGVLERKLARWDYGGFGGGSGVESISDYSRTNVQVEGVDEPDIVKTDGTYLYALGKKDFYSSTNARGYGTATVSIIRAVPAESAVRVGEIIIGTSKNADDILLFDDTLLIIGNRWTEEGEFEDSRTKITWMEYYDISDRENPRFVRTLEFEGSLVGARSINEYAYFAISTSDKSTASEGSTVIGEDVLDPNMFLPVYRDTLGTKEIPEFVATTSCGAVGKIEPVTSTSFLTLAVLPLKDREAPIVTDTIAGSGSDVYASQKNFYVASTRFAYSMPLKQRLTGFPVFERQDTVINKFSLNGADVEHVAQGFAPGTVLDQFSMDEYNGRFRIATTVAVGLARSREDITSGIYVFDEDLEPLGRVDGLAPGETIYSARFFGERAYLVTFEQIDPFFVIDLSDDKNPTVLGILKIPGFSDYLHPYDENRVIGVGMETTSSESGVQTKGVKIALFDVTDPENPTQEYMVTMGGKGSTSPVLSDHKAFLFDSVRNLVILPVLESEEIEAGYRRRYTFQGTYVYELTPESGFVLRGRVTQLPDDYDEISYSFSRNDVFIYRNVRIGEYLYAISSGKVTVYRLSDFNLVAEVLLTE